MNDDEWDTFLKTLGIVAVIVIVSLILYGCLHIEVVNDSETSEELKNDGLLIGPEK